MRTWAGLSTDLMIEQVMMRSLKASGGITRGRGMTAAEMKLLQKKDELMSNSQITDW